MTISRMKIRLSEGTLLCSPNWCAPAAEEIQTNVSEGRSSMKEPITDVTVLPGHSVSYPHLLGSRGHQTLHSEGSLEWAAHFRLHVGSPITGSINCLLARSLLPQATQMKVCMRQGPELSPKMLSSNLKLMFKC